MTDDEHPTFHLNRISALSHAEFYLASSVLSNPDDVLKHILGIQHDQHSIVKIWGNEYKIPRRQFACGDPGLYYSFSGSSVPARPWIPILKDVRDELAARIGYSYNFVLVNTYDDGNAHIGYHKDDERDLDVTYPIASVSLGATRDFLVKLDIPEEKSTTAIKIPLAHNTLLLMGKNSQKNYKHSVPKRKKVSTPRVNLTFRRMNV